MGEKTHVILSIKAYEDVLNYLSTTQIYGNIAQLISELVNDANANTQNLTIVTKVEPASPEAGIPEMQVVDEAKTKKNSK